MMMMTVEEEKNEAAKERDDEALSKQSSKCITMLMIARIVKALNWTHFNVALLRIQMNSIFSALH